MTQPPIPRLTTAGIVWQPPPPTWRGAQASTQAEADARMPELLEIAITGEVVTVRYLHLTPGERIELPSGVWRDVPDWLIVSGQTGPDAEPLHPQWVRSLRDQAKAAGVPFFFSSWGTWCPRSHIFEDDGSGTVMTTALHLPRSMLEWHLEDGTVMLNAGKRASGRLLDGREWVDMPEQH